MTFEVAVVAAEMFRRAVARRQPPPSPMQQLERYGHLLAMTPST